MRLTHYSSMRTLWIQSTALVHGVVGYLHEFVEDPSIGNNFQHEYVANTLGTHTAQLPPGLLLFQVYVQTSGSIPPCPGLYRVVKTSIGLSDCPGILNLSI